MHLLLSVYYVSECKAFGQRVITMVHSGEDAQNYAVRSLPGRQTIRGVKHSLKRKKANSYRGNTDPFMLSVKPLVII